ncbi:MAG: UDP-N-acetylmuramate dehydrogenase [bacterium]|nr:UDP-N-acetylmuramate dehydrogenase [bacterium]
MVIDIQENKPLKQLTTFDIGGSAAFYVTISSTVDLAVALDFAKLRKLEIFVLGGGSNILISDQGFAGLVIQNQIKGFETKETPEGMLVKIGAGEDWDHVVERSVNKGLYGIECLSGVPGSAGGAVVQNIGAYGQTIGDVVKSVDVVELKTGEKKIFNANQCEFEYRQSLFKKNSGKYIVTGFEIQLTNTGNSNLAYHDLVNYFKNKTGKPNLKEVREAVIETRAKKGYLVLPGYEKFKTAGSFFKNPIVDKDSFLQIKDWLEKHEIKGECLDPWFWEISPNKIKIAAPCLILHAGFKKGFIKGNVGVSPKHPLALINLGGASASELLNLADEITQAVKAKFGIELEKEVKLIGTNQ